MRDGESYNCRTCGGNHAVGFCRGMGKKTSLQQDLQMYIEALENFAKEVAMTASNRHKMSWILERIKTTLTLPENKIYIDREDPQYFISADQKHQAYKLIESELQNCFDDSSSTFEQVEYFKRITVQLKELLKI